MSERYAVLDHDWPEPHRDLFLERNGILLAWRLPAGCDLRIPLSAVKAADHRLHYLDYEGPVPGDRGTVAPWDRGTLVWIKYSMEYFQFELNGENLLGTFQLRHEHDGLWRFEPLPVT